MNRAIAERLANGTFTWPSSAARLLSRLIPAGGDCLEWIGSRERRDGHGTIVHEGRATKTHRLAWELAHGPITGGMCVCHHCDNPPCCNPDHLFLGTIADNNRDRHQKGRSKNVFSLDSHPMRKLSALDVERMRAMWADGSAQWVIAKEFSVSRGHVSKVVRS